jgi:hypothetical protein
MPNPTSFKSGGDASAAAAGIQSNFDQTALKNAGKDLGVALPDIQTDEDLTLQGQNVQAGAFGGVGGEDNVNQNISV